MQNELHFQLWSLAELPITLRNLSFPKYPFAAGKLGPVPADIRELFLEHQIIYYRDEVNPFGMIIDSPEGNEAPIVERSGFQAYRSSGICAGKTLTMLRWSPDRQPVRYRKIVTKHGDDYRWLMWNKLVVVQSMNEEQVQCA